MIEQIFHLSKTTEKTVEKLIMDENIHYLHPVLPKGEFMPRHISNATVYMTVLQGTLTMELGEQEPHDYEAGTVLKIPINTPMYFGNTHEALLELAIVKAPAPGK